MISFSLLIKVSFILCKTNGSDHSLLAVITHNDDTPTMTSRRRSNRYINNSPCRGLLRLINIKVCLRDLLGPIFRLCLREFFRPMIISNSPILPEQDGASAYRCSYVLEYPTCPPRSIRRGIVWCGTGWSECCERRPEGGYQLSHLRSTDCLTEKYFRNLTI